MNRVSSIRMIFVVLLLLFLSRGITSAITVQSAAPAKVAAGATQATRDPQKVFEGGEAALRAGKLEEAEHEFRQARAIHPFESVVQQSPDSYQARYLLGLCYFFNDRWTDAIRTLAPLWGKASDQLNYLYVLGIAAYKVKNP